MAIKRRLRIAEDRGTGDDYALPSPFYGEAVSTFTRIGKSPTTEK
jgi:hypothetical protein